MTRKRLRSKIMWIRGQMQDDYVEQLKIAEIDSQTRY